MLSIGIEPMSQDPQSCVLSIELRELFLKQNKNKKKNKKFYKTALIYLFILTFLAYLILLQFK